MKNFLLFNQSFGTEGSPNQTGETLTRENRIGLMSYLRRTLMLLFAVLPLSIANIGMAWGTDCILYANSSGSTPSGTNSSYTGITATFNSFKDGTYTIGTNDQGFTNNPHRFGGSGSGKNVTIVISAGYQAVITVYGQAGSTNKYMAVKTSDAAASSSDTYNTKLAATGTVYKLQTGTLSAGTYYVKSDGDGVALVQLEATVTPASSGKNIYLKPNGIWDKDGARFAAYYFKSSGSGDGWVDFASYNACTPCFKATIPSGYDKVILCRMDGSKAANNWDNKWNQTLDLTVPTGNDTCFTISSINGCTDGKSCGSWGTYTAPTYTISFAGNGNTGGSMSNISSIACEANQTVTANAYTRTGYSFTGWVANVDVTVGGSTKTAGTLLAEGVTIQDISSNITLTAQWEEEVTYSVTYNANGGTGSVPADATAYAEGASVTVLGKNTLSKAGSMFVGWRTGASSGTWYIEGNTFEMGGDDVTLYAQWRTLSCPSSGTMYSLTMGNVTTTEKVTHGTEVTIEKHATIVNGTATLKNKNGSSDDKAQFSKANPGQIYLNGADAQLKLELGCALAEGDSIIVTSSDTTHMSFTKTDSRSTTPATVTHARGKVYVIPAESPLIGCTTLYCWRRADKGLRVTKLIITRPVSCSTPAAPTNFTAGSISATGATFTITDAADAASYDIYYSTSSTAPTSGTDATTTSTSKTKEVTGLTAATTYYAWVRSVCDASHKSAWVALNPGGDTHTFATSCVAPTTVNVAATVNEVSGFWFYPDDDVVLTAAPTGSPAGSPVTYQWKKNGADIDGATSSTYTIDDAAASDAGKYTCTISYGACSTTSAEFELKCMQFYLKNSGGSDISNHALTKVDATHATLSLSLTGGTTYNFRVTDGCNNWYGNSDATGITSSNCSNWTMPHDADCKVTTSSKSATYTFNFDFSAGLLGSEMKVSVVYPAGDQAEGKVIYWDNSVLNWASAPWYRIGKGTHSTKTQMTLVPGTAKLYKVTTAEYNGFEYWHIANNEGEGTGNIFWTNDSDPATNEAITAAMGFEGSPVTADAVTFTPTSSHATGSSSDNDNCEFYEYGQQNGMKTDRVTISPYSNGTITVNYVDTDEEAATLTSGNADLAHSVILTSITAVADEGYDASAITINGGAYSANYVVTGNTTIAASFTPHVYTITYKDQGNVAFSGTHTDTPSAHPTSHTYNTATNLNGATKAGYTFDGWYTTSACTGDPVTSLGATAYTADITLYAKWTANSYSVAVTLTDSKATQESGDTGDNAATHGSNYVATFEAVSGYELPSDVIVYIGESQATKDDEYTWSISDGTGTLTINGDEILDDITITVTATSTCSTPADPDGLAAGSISSSGVTFTITDDESPASYDIYYSTSSTAPTGSTDASTTTTSKSKLVTGLTANTTYYAWVRAVCNDDYKSDWVALGTSTFKTLATGTKYYLFTPTSAPNPSHTGTLSGAFISPSATSSSETIDTYTFTKNITFGGTLSSISGNKAGDKNITYYNKTSSTKFTLYVKNTNGSQQILYINKIVEGETSVTVANCTIPASTAKSVEYTYETSDNTTFAFSVGNTSLVIYQIVVEEAGTAHKVAGENGYALNLNKGRVACPLSDKADISVNGFLIKAPYNNYKFTNSSELQIEKDKESSTYIKFTTPASPGRLKLTYTGSSGVQMAYNTSASDDGATSITSATAYTLSASTTYYLVNTGTQTAKITKIEFVAPLSGYTVSITADPDGYGTVSASSVSSVASGTTLSASTNTLSVGATNVTASATSASAEYTYSFNNWTKSDGTALPSTVTADLSVYANFTRTANNYTLTWNTNGGSDLDCDVCTSGSTAYGASITAPSDPTLSNYTFDGWKTNNDGTGTTAGATMPAAATTYYAAWKQTVTLKTGAQGSGADQTPYVYINGTALNGFSAHTATGYTLQGYYTAGSGGVKVLNADGTFAAANVTDYITSSKWSRTGAAPTLFAQWVATEDCHTLKYAWKITGKFCDDGSTSVTASDTVRFPANASNLYFTVSGTGNTVTKGSSYNLGNTQNNYFLLTAKTGYQIKSICFYGKVQDSSVDYTTDGSSWSSLTSTNTSGDDYYSFSSINASAFGIKLTAATPEGVWIRNMVIEVCAAGGTTYNVTYDGNDETGGTAPTDASSPYTYGTTVTVLGNTGELEKTNYTFAGWSTNNDGTGSNYVADNTFSITGNTTLYAKWTQSVTLDKNGGSTDGSATAVWNATGLTGITHAKPAAGYKLLGYYSASSEGTKVLNSDGSFAATNVIGYITSGKWSRTSATTLYAEYESAGALTWNLIVNSDTANLSTSTKTSAFTEISTTNMTNATLAGDLTYEKSKKSALTGKISTPASYDADDYVYVTFQVASGYKFIPSLISVPIQPVGDGEHKAVKLSLTDTESHSLVSGSATKCDGTVKGKTTTVTLAGDGSKFFEGTVTLKIYVYPHASATASSNNCYRLGTPITIEGEIEEACGTMPSYTSMSYTTTTFSPGADASGSPITIVGGENIDTYQWKYNKVNDRTSGTNCGTGTSLTPLTDEDAATDGTRYYWCEMTNTSCGITIKSPAVAITVAAAKSNATVTWTNPESTPNYGGGGYTIKAMVDQIGWDGNAADLVITAPAGIRIYNVTSGTDGNSRKYVQADFDVQTSFDRSAYASNIPFTVSAAATASYNAISDDHNVSYSACSGGGGGSSYKIRVRKSYDKDASNNYRWVTPGAGEITYAVGSSISSGKAGTAMATDFDSIMSSDKQYIWVKTFVGNIKQMRLYVETSGANISVSALYQRTTYAAADAKDVITGYSVVYDEDDDAENTGTKGQHTIDLIFTSALSANDIICVKFSSSKVKALGAAITEGSAGSLNTYLQWSGGLENGATVNKNTTDAYFTYSASKITSNTNTLGAITYSSSNTSVATVDATGKVALVAAGSTTIKATLAASGCYKKAEISYTLNVTEVACAITAGTLTLTSGTESKCSSANVTLTLTGFESGASIQWKDGDTDINNGGNYTIETDGTTSTLTTDQEGTYSVMVTSGCSVRSNRITISNKSTEVGAKRIVKNWYIKNGRPTPDIELWTLQNGAHLNSVAWDPANTTGLTASDFYESDGKVYLKGKEPSSNTSGADINYTLTLTVEDDCGSTTDMSASGQLIYLHHQQNTDKHVLAFVVNGTDKGGFTEGITAAQTTSVPLYNEIAANFDVLATNIKSTDDEQALKEYYSQFDILCVTDYPNTGDKGVNKKSYVDALGALVDIRPILTMEAFVAKLANWKAKGISGTPQSPTTRQYTMLLQCKDHEIFSGTERTKVGEGDETMYRVSMVDNTQEEYVSLDATYGEGAHAEKSGYNYGGKPALQGFTFTKEMLDDDLLPLGLIDDGSGNDLQVGIERQTEMEARLMVLGINSYAMERLTDDGQTVVVNALKYLMKKNSEDIADCSNTFVGGDDEEDESTRYDWNVDSHWSGNAVPERTQKVRIVAPCVIKADEKFHVTGVVIAPSGKYNHGANTANGSLTIAAGGALIVDGKVEAATAPLYTETRATTPTDLILKTNSTAQSALIFDNDKGETQATVELYSLGRKESGSYYYQYMAVPMESLPVNPSFAGSGIYTYVWNEASGWERRGYYTDLYAFEGVGITTKFADAKTYTMKGALASTETREIALTHNTNGQNMIGNSWTAPIQIADLKEDNSASEIIQTVYIYSTGNGNTVSDGTTASAGQWLAIPFSAAGFEAWDGLKVIPAMQTFNINVTGTSTLTLDYDKVVRKRAAKMSVDTLTTPLHAPKRSAAHEGVELMRIRVEDSQTHTDLYLFKGERFSDEFDNGWEAEYLNGDGRSAKLYAQTEIGKMAVVATDELEGTVLGFEPGKETEYTFTFGGEGMGYYLNDLKLKKSTWINAGETYSFTYEEGDINRFIISTTPITTIMTGCESVGAEAAKVRKVIIDDKVYIIRIGHMYSVDGQMVK